VEGPSRNVELKARDRDPARSLRICEALKADDRGLLRQRDTYFEVSRGRLKLREQDDDLTQLIAYQRPDGSGERKSSYRLVEVGSAEDLKAALAAALGVLVVVTKERRLFLWEGVRIHLDAVEGLGSFVEFEAVASRESGLETETERVVFLRERFQIEDDDLIATGYSDLLLGALPNCG
jgi:adenylate cyclase, class 2